MCWIGLVVRVSAVRKSPKYLLCSRTPLAKQGFLGCILPPELQFFGVWPDRSAGSKRKMVASEGFNIDCFMSGVL